MRSLRRPALQAMVLCCCALLASNAHAVARIAISDTTWTDHDGQPGRMPPKHDEVFWAHEFHQAVVDPLTHAFDIPDKLLFGARVFGVPTRREAVNVNAFDEVSNSTWFTNRNHVRAVPVADLLQGPDSSRTPAKPWTITHPKKGGMGGGFQIKDTDGLKWVVKIDVHGYSQLSSGADVVARTLLHAAGYNVPHNEMVRFVRSDLTIDSKLLQGAEGEHFVGADLDTLLAHTALDTQGRYVATASLFLPGKVVGSPNMNHRRRTDPNDWYAPANRRELRGLSVISAWLNFWDTKDDNFLDTFIADQGSLGHLQHYILDPGSSLGANATGPKELTEGFENTVDWGWMARRFVTLGFVTEPWRRADQESGIPSVGNFESAVFTPRNFVTEVPQPAFRSVTDRDGYWGAKLVASFSDAQIAAAVAAAHYDDPRASTFIVQRLIERRNKVVSHWFARVAPLDFFSVQGDTLHLHDLAADLGIAARRSYVVSVVKSTGGKAAGKRMDLTTPSLPLAPFGTGFTSLTLELGVRGSRARPAVVELSCRESGWVVTRVRHGD
jgi:hypothetical protein